MSTKVLSTIKESVTSQVFNQVLKMKPSPAVLKKTLREVSPDKKWAEEMANLYIDALERTFFPLTFKSKKNATIQEIIDHITESKKRGISYR